NRFYWLLKVWLQVSFLFNIFTTYSALYAYSKRKFSGTPFMIIELTGTQRINDCKFDVNYVFSLLSLKYHSLVST
ncbi:MAG: hypothetical protein L0G58_07090, partial [Acinetobacter sp.]|nr:hypothetical protein [Acinetobacter sp.]